ncbi:MAG: cytochrome c nitrite reductase small subunit [Planctomycetes bacterium]|nr:cytochrome c nitrite reductase small subunit [Planctomycetota bacterium]
MRRVKRLIERAVVWLNLEPLPRRWRWPAFVALGAAAGLALAVARISNAASYLTNSPETCINCHVMTDAYASWQRGSHGKVAVCTDCHVPHSNVVAKQAFKAMDGLRHSAIFTLRLEPQVLGLSRGAVPVVQANCLRCHAGQFAMVRLAASAERPCWECHSNIHGEARSLSATPHPLRPALPPAGLSWMKKGANP